MSQKEKFEDAKGVVKICKLKDRLQPKEKGQTMIYKTLHRELKIK